MIIAVAMSGGVDSSTAAWLLKNSPDLVEKYPKNLIIGLTHWWEDLRQSSPDLQERAAKVCKSLGIPYQIIDMGCRFREAVIDDFIDCYLKGETPNPCVRCNEKIRFNDFFNSCYKLAVEQFGIKLEDFRFCTGHYVRTEKINNKVFLKKAIDPLKDQSYMLYRIPKNVLSHCIFPLGEYTKEKIKEIADEQKFFGKAIKESQDICFISDNYISFLKRTINKEQLKIMNKPGKILDTKGNFLGVSRGFTHYTIGQRKGLGLGDGPWYVASIDAEKNIVTVGRKEQLGLNEFYIKESNWFINPPDSESRKTLSCTVQVRYNSKEHPCEVSLSARGWYFVKLKTKAIISPGQSAVFYDGDIVLGGGIICNG